MKSLVSLAFENNVLLPIPSGVFPWPWMGSLVNIYDLLWLPFEQISAAIDKSIMKFPYIDTPHSGLLGWLPR